MTKREKREGETKEGKGKYLEKVDATTVVSFPPMLYTAPPATSCPVMGP